MASSDAASALSRARIESDAVAENHVSGSSAALLGTFTHIGTLASCYKDCIYLGSIGDPLYLVLYDKGWSDGSVSAVRTVTPIPPIKEFPQIADELSGAVTPREYQAESGTPRATEGVLPDQ